MMGSVTKGSMLSYYDEWKRGARCIFIDSVLDQVQKASQGDWRKEVEEIYQCLEHNEDCIREDAELSELEISLSLPKNDFESIANSVPDKKEQRYQLARLFVERAYRYIKDAEKAALNESYSSLRSGKVEPTPSAEHTMVGLTPSRQESTTEVKCVAPPQTQHNTEDRRVTEFNRQTSRAFTIKCNRDLSILKNYEAPCAAFQRTGKFNVIWRKIVEQKIKVLHVYGRSGTGKSQIARGICKDIDKNCPNYLIQHVQCQTGGNTIVKKWQRYVEDLKNKEFPFREEDKQICQDLEECDVRSFHLKLKMLEFSTLLLVEDVGKKKNPDEEEDKIDDVEKKLIRNFVNELLNSDVTNVQLVIVTQQKDSLFLDGHLAEMPQYECIKITGFTEEEAKNFIKRGNGEEKMISELAKELAYSPLRLFMAKSYCIKEGISFEEYYQSLGKDEDVIKREKEILKKHPELGEHGYDVIMKVLRPKENASIEELAQFEVIKMMSFLNHSTIPDVLLGAFFHEIREFENVEDVHKQVRYLLRKLEEGCDMTVRTHRIDLNMYGQQTATIHNDILSVVRFSMDTREKQRVIIKVLGAVITLVGKENRFRTDHTLLFDMLNHMNRVAGFASELLVEDLNLSKPDQDNFELLICLSRLYEVLGFATTQHAESKDVNFAKAIDYLWNVACLYTGNSILRSCFGKSVKVTNKLQAALHYEVGKDPKETAMNAYKRLHEASLKLPIKSVMKNCGRFFPITPELLEDMKLKTVGEQIDWGAMEKELKKKRRLSDKQINVLRQNGMLLTPQKLHCVYLTECIASILHSRGRQVLYLKQSIPVEEQKRYEWYTDVGLELCKLMFKNIGVKSIFEYILQANNKLPRMLHARQGESDLDLWQRIEKAREIAVALSEEKNDFYEHGVYKLVSGTPFTVMSAMRYVVKANTKLYKRPDVARRHPIPTAIVECEQLLKIAKENVGKLVLASNCMVHVGKYYAAIKEYEKALQAFEDGFNYKGHGIASHLEKNPNYFSWALYNCGRVLYASGGNVYKGAEHIERFNDRYEMVIIPRSIREDLDEIKLRVNNLCVNKSYE